MGWFRTVRGAVPGKRILVDRDLAAIDVGLEQIQSQGLSWTWLAPAGV